MERLPMLQEDVSNSTMLAREALQMRNFCCLDYNMVYHDLNARVLKLQSTLSFYMIFNFKVGMVFISLNVFFNEKKNNILWHMKNIWNSNFGFHHRVPLEHSHVRSLTYYLWLLLSYNTISRHTDMAKPKMSTIGLFTGKVFCPQIPRKQLQVN